MYEYASREKQLLDCTGLQTANSNKQKITNYNITKYINIQCT